MSTLNTDVRSERFVGIDVGNARVVRHRIGFGGKHRRVPHRSPRHRSDGLAFKRYVQPGRRLDAAGGNAHHRHRDDGGRLRRDGVAARSGR